MSRPALDRSLSAEEFKAWYWLKEELIAFCRANGVPASGSKQAITERIALFLDTGEIAKPAPKRRKAKMPTEFTRQTIIGEGWRSSQELRFFFEREIGTHFHFNKFMRDFIKSEGVGKTLQEAIDGWIASKQAPKGTNEIDSQFEYNRHFREYFQQNPNATREEAITAWRIKRNTRK